MAETVATNTTATTATETTATNTTAQTNQTQTAAPETTQRETNLDKLIQRAVDRVTNKLGNENKKLREENDTLKKANLSDAEVRQMEIQDKEKEIAEREKALAEKENRWAAMKAIKEAGLDDGGDAALAIVDFVMAENEDAIKERVKAFGSLVERIVKGKVEAVFKANGRTPGVGSDSAANAGGQTESLAVRMGKQAAQTNQNSRSILDHYMGGKK